MATANERLPAESETLLKKVRELRETEQRKRAAPISSDEFHELAREVTRKSNEIMYRASLEEAVGDETDSSTESIDDVEERQETDADGG